MYRFSSTCKILKNAERQEVVKYTYTHTCVYIYIYIYIQMCILVFHLCIYIYIYTYRFSSTCIRCRVSRGDWIYMYGVATISRLLQILDLFCKRALLKRLYSAKETYNFKEPTNCSHPIQLYPIFTYVYSGCPCIYTYICI